LGYERREEKSTAQAGWLSLMTLILIMTGAWYHYARSAPVVLLPLTLQAHRTNLAPVLTLNLWRAQFVSRVPELVLTYSGMFFALFGFYYFRRAKAFPFLLYWLVASLLYVPLLGEYGLIHRYTLLPLAPVAAVWIACGINAFWEHAQSNFAKKFLAVILVIGIPIHAALRIKHWYHVEYQYVDRAHATLARISQPTDLVLVASHEAPELIYYLDRYGYAIEPNLWQPQDVSQILHRGVHFIFIPIEDNRPTLAKWKDYLKTRARLLEQDPEYLLYRIPA
jgi:hypothetical protein